MALLVSSNNTLKCSDTFFSDGETCRLCPVSCLSCRDVSSCLICTAGTSLSPDGSCAPLQDATVQTHAGAVACADSFFATNWACESCADRFASVCPGCSLCDGERCLRCDGDIVFDNGAWRESPQCSRADGNVCTSCVDGAVHFNSTDCVPVGDCMEYLDGQCVSCMKGLVVQPDGRCAETEHCSECGEGICLRCTTGKFADKNGVCKCSSQTRLTSSVRRVVLDMRVQLVVLPFV